MVELMKVFSPDGEIFEVVAEKARDLVINHGWSLNVPGETENIIAHVASMHTQGPLPVNITDTTG